MVYSLLELNPVPQTVPSKERRHVGDEPLLHQSIAIKVRWSPQSLADVGSSEIINGLIVKLIKLICSLPVIFREVFISPEIDVIIDSISILGLVSATASGSEEHFEPVFLQVVIEVAPS